MGAEAADLSTNGSKSIRQDPPAESLAEDRALGPVSHQVQRPRQGHVRCKPQTETKRKQPIKPIRVGQDHSAQREG